MSLPSSPTQEPPSEGRPDALEGSRYMTILEHLGELRNRLIISALALVISTGASIYFGSDIIEFLKEPDKRHNPDFNPIFTEPLEMVGAYFRVSLLSGLILAMPVIVYEALM